MSEMVSARVSRYECKGVDEEIAVASSSLNTMNCNALALLEGRVFWRLLFIHTFTVHGTLTSYPLHCPASSAPTEPPSSSSSFHTQNRKLQQLQQNSQLQQLQQNCQLQELLQSNTCQLLRARQRRAGCTLISETVPAIAETLPIIPET